MPHWADLLLLGQLIHFCHQDAAQLLWIAIKGYFIALHLHVRFRVRVQSPVAGFVVRPNDISSNLFSFVFLLKLPPPISDYTYRCTQKLPPNPSRNPRTFTHLHAAYQIN